MSNNSSGTAFFASIITALGNVAVFCLLIVYAKNPVQ
jgi:hypothetical protein